MKCPKCQFENAEEMQFCGKCGAKLEKICPQCNFSNQADFMFCGKCGHNFRKPGETPPIDYSEPQSYTPKFLADKILTTRSSIEGERKLVTVLFADVANYTAMSEKLDPEEVHQIMDGCFKILMDEIHNHEGTINQFTGDGVMALFGAPVAHENHAQRACNASIAIQKSMEKYEKKIEGEYGAVFKMRIGINSGPVIVGSIGDDLRMDYTAVGDTTNLAARIQQAANPGEICLSQATRNLVHDYFEYESKGDVYLKGKAAPQSMYCLITERSQVRTRFEASLLRGVTEFVGRRPEMSALQTLFERAKTGDAQIVDVVGEAGVGKSRLVYEFKNALGDEAMFLTGICIQYGGTINFLPLIDIVKAVFGIMEELTEEEAGRRIEDTATNDLSVMIPFYRNLLSLKVNDPNFTALEPEGRKFGTFEAVKNLLLAMIQKKPLVIFIEDVHWIDKISEEFFTFFSRCILGHRILMLSAYRPEGSPPWAQEAVHYQRLGIETLSSDSSIRLVHNMLGGLAIDPNLEKRIAEKAGGNPFFVEEIVRELIERGDIKKDGNRYVSIRPIDELEIPNTVQGVLAARMDRLNEDIKRTMQVASVIGRDFTFRILRSIRELGHDLKIHMNNLIGLEILYEKTLYPELEYIFKHALTQEVAYHSLLKQRRREIHDSIGQAIEELYSDRLEEHYELLAHHYERSGNISKTIDYLILAGEKSNRHSAVYPAYEFFQKAIKLSESKEIHLEKKTEVRLCHGWAVANLGIGAIGESVKWLRKTIDLSQLAGMIEYEKRSLFSLAFTMYFWPDRVEADRIHEYMIDRAQQLKDKALESQILSWKCICECCYNTPLRGYQVVLDAQRIALEAKDPYSIHFNRATQAWPERWLGRPMKTIELTNTSIEILEKVFSFDLLSNSVVLRGMALAEVGRIDDAMTILNYGIGISEKFGPFYRHASFLNTLGYCYSEIHQHDLAWSLNLQSEEIARDLIKKYPMGRPQYSEIAAQAIVNQMENMFYQGKIDEAWKRFKIFEEESKDENFDFVRYVWESRMYYLAAQILIYRNDLGKAVVLIKSELERARKLGLKKREGCFLRLMGEVQTRRNEYDKAVENLSNAILILKDVNNLRQIWQAHASLGSAFDEIGRRSEAQDQWGAAAEIIQNMAKGLSDNQLKESFLNAHPIKRILSKQ